MFTHCNGMLGVELLNLGCWVEGFGCWELRYRSRSWVWAAAAAASMLIEKAGRGREFRHRSSRVEPRLDKGRDSGNVCIITGVQVCKHACMHAYIQSYN